MEVARVLVVLGLAVVMLGLLHPATCRPSTAASPVQSARQMSHRDKTASKEAFGAIGGIVLNQFLSLVLNRLTEDDSSSPTSQQGRMMQGTEAPEFTEIRDELAKEIEDFLYDGTDTAAAQTEDANTHQGQEKAQVQFVSSNTWNNARECLNDILSPNDRGSPTRNTVVAINEVKSILAGKKALAHASSQVRLNWPVIRGCVDRFVNNPNGGEGARNQFFGLFDDDCILEMVVIAITGTTQNSQTVHPPFLEMTVDSETQRIQLPTVTGDEFQRGRGDLWTFDIAEFGFSDTCIEVEDVEGLAVVEGGTDGWLIASIVTQVLNDDGEYEVLSSDLGADRWIDGNGGEQRKRFDLTLNN